MPETGGDDASSRPYLFRGDFARFFVGQSISSLGNAVTQFSLPLIVFKLTESAVDLGVTMAATFLPYLLFGLPLGAWVDRVDRRRLMIWTDLGRAVVLAFIPLLSLAGVLDVWQILLVTFVNSTLGIAFDAAQFAAIPSLVGDQDLATANGRIQASYSAAAVAGPPLAGLFVGWASVESVLVVDALSFVVSAMTLTLIRRPFNAVEPVAATSIRRDVLEGLRYVFGHPVLRNISIMMALVNFVGVNTGAQLVLFAHERFDASDQRIGLLYSAGSVGVIVLSLAAGPLRRRFSFSRIALGALIAEGLTVALFAVVGRFWVALALWALSSGLGVLFNIMTGSLRQAIVPNALLGRVISVASVLAWSAIPLGTLTGGWIVERSGNVAAVYLGVGLTTAAIATAFAYTPLGRAEEYLLSQRDEVASQEIVTTGDPAPRNR